MNRNDKMELLLLLKDVGAARAAAEWLAEKDADADAKAKAPPPKRRIQYKLATEDGASVEWGNAQADELIAGQTIRMFEPDGTPVDFGYGQTEAVLEYAEVNPRANNGFIFMVQLKSDGAQPSTGDLSNANCSVRLVGVERLPVGYVSTFKVTPLDTAAEYPRLAGLHLAVNTLHEVLFFPAEASVAAEVRLQSSGDYRINLGKLGTFTATKIIP